MSHVVHYGSSVFEGIRCYALPSGPAIFRATEHIQRLLDSARIYRIDVPFTRDQIISGMVELVGHNGVWPCYVRPVVLRGYGEAGVNPFNSPTEVIFCNYPWGKYLGPMPARAWTLAFLPGPASPPTRCPPWPRPVRIT